MKMSESKLKKLRVVAQRRPWTSCRCRGAATSERDTVWIDRS